MTDSMVAAARHRQKQIDELRAQNRRLEERIARLRRFLQNAEFWFTPTSPVGDFARRLIAELDEEGNRQ